MTTDAVSPAPPQDKRGAGATGIPCLLLRHHLIIATIDIRQLAHFLSHLLSHHLIQRTREWLEIQVLALLGVKKESRTHFHPHDLTLPLIVIEREDVKAQVLKLRQRHVLALLEMFGHRMSQAIVLLDRLHIDQPLLHSLTARAILSRLLLQVFHPKTELAPRKAETLLTSQDLA